MEKENLIDSDVLAGKIQLIVSRIKSDSNPEELDRLKKIYKKNVPFSLRGYFTAYLLREAEGKAERRNGARDQRKRDKEQKPQRGEKRAEKKPAAPVKKENAEAREERKPRVIPEGAKTLYVNLGKMGRIYARDLINLLMDGTGITKDDIFSIKVHDKYSFVTMSEDNCNKAIAALLGKDVNGRTVQINISNRDTRKNALQENTAEESSEEKSESTEE